MHRADFYLQRQQMEDSSLSAEADLWPVCVFALETPTWVLQTQSNRKTSTGDGGVVLSWFMV